MLFMKKKNVLQLEIFKLWKHEKNLSFPEDQISFNKNSTLFYFHSLFLESSIEQVFSK